MSYENLIWEQDGGVGRLTLNRPGLAERLDRATSGAS